jgi:hypothetical protein
MSTNTKIVTWVIVAVVVIGGGVLWWMHTNQTSMAPTATTTAPTPTQAQTTPQTQTPPSNGISMTDNSDAALQTDLSNIDSQMNGFSSDNASINQGLNDQPVAQSQL